MASFSLQEEAVFAVGNFWDAQRSFGGLRGVIMTGVGYCGGTTGAPTYHDIGDHVESISILFDQRIVSYDELLQVFFKLSKSSLKEARYANKIFYTSDHQRKVATSRLKELHGEHDIEIVPMNRFWPAEKYHQSYLAKLHGEQ